MWNANNIYDFYQTIYNISNHTDKISKRRISSYNIIIISFLSFIFLMIFICLIKLFVRRYGKYKKHNDVHLIKQPILKKTPIEKNQIETSSQSNSIQ